MRYGDLEKEVENRRKEKIACKKLTWEEGILWIKRRKAQKKKRGGRGRKENDNRERRKKDIWKRSITKRRGKKMSVRMKKKGRNKKEKNKWNDMK